MFSATALAKIESEAFWAVEIKGKPVGFSVQRNEINPTSGERTTSYLLKTTSADNDMEQFVAIKQNKAMAPVSYRFDSRVRNVVVHANGRVDGPQMKVSLRDDKGPKDPKPFDLMPETIFSTSLGPALAKQKLVKGQAYSFDAISEEDGLRAPGEVLVLGETTVGKRRLYRLILRYQRLEQEAWMLDDGLMVRTESTSLPVRSVLVADGRQAMSDVDQEPAILSKYFGDPLNGKINPISRGELTIDDRTFPKTRDLASFEGTRRIPIKPSN